MATMAPLARAEPHLTQAHVSAMGSDVTIVGVDVDDAALATGAAAIQELERRWSRFLPDSEISRINGAAGRPVRVSRPTATLVALAVRGWRATCGAYDPTVLGALVAAGYDRPFDQLPTDCAAAPDSTTHPTPGCAGITADPDTGVVRLPAGVHIDPGGIGKGLAADMLTADGATGALVDLGGDIRCAGTPPRGGWRIDVEHPGWSLQRLSLDAGAVATSSTHRRRWRRDGVEHHHLINPATGDAGAGPGVAATVVAGSAWRAEVLTKAIMLAGSVDAAERTLTAAAAGGILVDTDGQQHLLARIERFLR